MATALLLASFRLMSDSSKANAIERVMAETSIVIQDPQVPDDVRNSLVVTYEALTSWRERLRKK